MLNLSFTYEAIVACPATACEMFRFVRDTVGYWKNREHKANDFYSKTFYTFYEQNKAASEAFSSWGASQTVHDVCARAINNLLVEAKRAGVSYFTDKIPCQNRHYDVGTVMNLAFEFYELYEDMGCSCTPDAIRECAKARLF